MPTSQNARFSGEASPDANFEHPPGAAITRLLKEALVKRGWDVSDFDNWRDGGWSIMCCRPMAKLELVIAKSGKGSEWFLQIAPSYVPGFIGWLFRKQASAQPESIQALAQDAYLILSENARFRDFLWCWDGYPERGFSAAEPIPARDSDYPTVSLE